MAIVDTSLLCTLRGDFQKLSKDLVASGVPGSVLIERLDLVLGENQSVRSDLKGRLMTVILGASFLGKQREWRFFERVEFDALIGRIEWNMS